MADVGKRNAEQVHRGAEASFRMRPAFIACAAENHLSRVMVSMLGLSQTKLSKPLLLSRMHFAVLLHDGSHGKVALRTNVRSAGAHRATEASSESL